MEGLFVYRDTWLERTMEIWQSDNNIGRSMSYLIYAGGQQVKMSDLIPTWTWRSYLRLRHHKSFTHNIEILKCSDHNILILIHASYSRDPGSILVREVSRFFFKSRDFPV